MSEEGESLRERLRTPALVWVALMLLLALLSAVGVFLDYDHWWIVEVICLGTMVSLVIIFSMEMKRHQPIVRLFSVLGFFWVGILFGMTMTDYLTR